MKGVELLFSENRGGSNREKIQGKTIIIENRAVEGLFTGLDINKLIGTINSIHRKYGTLKCAIEIRLGRIKFIDKLSYIFLECLCFYLIKNYGHPVQIYMEVETDIGTQGISSSPLLLLNRTRFKSIEKFPEKFMFDLYGYHFRRVISCNEGNTNYLGDLYEEIDRFLKPFSIDDECRDQVALTVAELVGNACEHADSECLVDIDVAPNYKKNRTENIDDNVYYYGVNVAVVNFSDKTLGDDIKNNILIEKEDNLHHRYKDVIEAYKYHSSMFSDKYTEEDFCNITAFQSRISGRKEKFLTGGTGLPVLLKSLGSKSEANRCYVISGKRSVNFFQEAIEYNNDGWIGFNVENNYLSAIPMEEVVNECLIYMPGTAYNFNFILKGEEIEYGKQNRT